MDDLWTRRPMAACSVAVLGLGLLLAPLTSTAAEPSFVVGGARAYRPVLTQAIARTAIQPFVHLASRAEWVSALDGSIDLPADLGVDLLGRIGVRYHTMTALSPYFVAVEAEADLPTGFVTAAPVASGASPPHSDPLGIRVRRAGLKLGLKDILDVAGGVVSPNWGLGLVYNSGEERWEPGRMMSAAPREGDRALRAALSSTIVPDLGLRVFAGWEMPLVDAATLELGPTHTLRVAAVFGAGKPQSVGLLGEFERSGDDTAAASRWLVDIFAKTRVQLTPTLTLDIDVEGAIALPELGDPSFGVGLRTRLGDASWGVGLDAVFCSGASQEDGLGAFRADRNFVLGWMLLPYIKRAQQSASIQQGMTNVLGFQPKARLRPMDGLEVYVGALLALEPVGDGPSDDWSLLGVELGLGARWRAVLWGTELTLGVEVGSVVPLAALPVDEVSLGARFLFDFRL